MDRMEGERELPALEGEVRDVLLVDLDFDVVHGALHAQGPSVMPAVSHRYE